MSAFKVNTDVMSASRNEILAQAQKLKYYSEQINEIISILNTQKPIKNIIKEMAYLNDVIYECSYTQIKMADAIEILISLFIKYEDKIISQCLSM